MAFYLIEDRWLAFKDTLVYRLYYEYLDRILGRWPLLVEQLADRKIQAVLTELIAPDEIFAWGVSQESVAVTVWGDTSSYWD